MAKVISTLFISADGVAEIDPDWHFPYYDENMGRAVGEDYDTADVLLIGRGWRSGWVLSYHTDGNGNSDDYIVGLALPDVDAAVAQAREYLRSVGYPAAGWPSS